jgi:hypothetical protein
VKFCSLASVFFLAACSAPPPVVPAPVASVEAPPPPPPPSPRKTDPRWILAASEDPLEKARLAVAVGAAELLRGVEDGGETADIALAALPFADDGEVALGRLGELIGAASPGRARILAAILGVAGQPRRQREGIDPDGARRCGLALIALAADRGAPREERAMAVSAARALAEKGLADPARIPSELDPR